MPDAPTPGSGDRPTHPRPRPPADKASGPADDGPFSRQQGGTEQETTDLYRLLVESVRDYAIFALDRTGHIISWNPGAERIKGWKAHEIIGKHFSTFYRAEDIAAGKPEAELEEAQRVGRVEDEGWRVRKDGTQFWANVVITALRDESGELVGFGKVTRDLTERRDAQLRAVEDARRLATEEAGRHAAELRTRELADVLGRLQAQTVALERQRRDAEEANRAKADFLAAMSHELRTPLNAIGGYAELLEMGVRGPVSEDQRQDLERIRRSQQYLLGLINEILSFSRIEAGRITYDLGPVPAAGPIETVVAMLTPQAARKGIEIRVRECDPRVIAWADRPKVEQILLNVIGNALKFTEAGGRVTVQCRAGREEIEVAIADTGVGIAADRQEEIFEPFVQVGRSLVHAVEGTGLGLAISRDLARAMGGDLIVASIPGQGSTFTLSLPVAGPASRTGPAPATRRRGA